MNSKPEIVISGIGGIYPKCINSEDFMEILLQNKSAAEQAKWIRNANGNTLYNNFPEKRHQHFDGIFFGVHRQQSVAFDPMTRLFMEASFEAIIDAGVFPADLRGRKIPVICGSTVAEVHANFFDPDPSKFEIIGQSRCMAANRVSYYLNLNGPSITLDANWTGGLQAILEAVTMIESGVYEAAIVGATNLSIGPYVQQLMESRGIICKDGRTKPYTEQADGYSRGDAVVVLFLQRAEDAKRHYASLLYVDVRFNGDREKGITEHDVDYLTKFLQECYDKSGIDPNNVSYLETNGCGLKDLDEMELAAVEKIFCKNRKSPLQIGSVKTNIGHTEPVSGIVSLIKIIIAMETGIIPAHLNFDLSDTKIPALIDGTIEVVADNKKWDGDIAALSCLGLMTFYGHMIVRRNQNHKLSPTTDLPVLINYSTRTEDGIRKINEKVLSQSPDLSYNKLVKEVFSNNISGHLYRGYTLKATRDRQGFKHISGITPLIWFVYSGMGSQWNTMGRDLMKITIFAEAITKCHNLLKPEGVDLIQIVTDENPHIFDDILNSFIGITAIQIGLTDVLESIGITPGGIIGHSMGEIACAYADKCLTAEQAILCSYYRGRASNEAELIVGMMAVIGLGYSKIKNICPESIEVACHNSTTNCTISGPSDDVKKFVEKLQSDGVFVKLVNFANIAYHSKYIKPAGPILLSYLKKVIPHPKKRSTKWICTSVPQRFWRTDLAKTVSAEYLTNNLLSFVYFEEGLTLIPHSAVLLEIAPHGIMQAILRRALPEVVNIPLMIRETNSLEYLFNSLGEIYINGVNFNMSPLYPDIPLPVPRGTRSLCSLVQWEHQHEWPSTAFDTKLETYAKSYMVKSEEISDLTEEQIDTKTIIPFSVYFGYICDLVNKENDVRSITIKDIIFEQPIKLDLDDSTLVTIMYQPGSGHFEVSKEGNKISHNNNLILSGIVKVNSSIEAPAADIENNKETYIMTTPDFYKELGISGYDYPDKNKLVSSVTLQENELTATIQHTEDMRAFLSSAFQLHIFYKNQISRQTYLPKYIQSLHVEFVKFRECTQGYSVCYNNITNVMESNCGVHIKGIEYEAVKPKPVPVKVQNVKFVAHSEELIQDVQTGFEMLSKIVTENTSNENVVITELTEKPNLKWLPYIAKYLEKNKIKAVTYELSDADLNKLQNSSLTIISEHFFDVIPQIISKVENYILLCIRSNQIIGISNKYTVIASFCTKNTKFYLIKKINITSVVVINVQNRYMSLKNIQTVLWTAELEAAVNGGKRLFVVCRALPDEGLEKFIREIQNPGHKEHKFRFLFILDLEAPECKPENEFYARVFEQDLIVQILKDGSWGSFLNISEDLEENIYSNILCCAARSNDLLNLCKPKYFGLHLKNWTSTDSDSDSIFGEIGALNFSGIDRNGHRTMGFGQLDPEKSILETDLEFVWNAYYALFFVADRTDSDSILILGGHTEIGFAALYLACKFGHTVYTTVQNKTQRNYIKRIISTLHDSNILDCSPINYTRTINTLTRGQGVQIILNCLPVTDHLEACKSILPPLGRFIQLTSTDKKNYNTTGMFIFNECISFYGITGQNLFQLPQDVKQLLHKMVADGIKEQFVAPIPRKLFMENEIEDGLRYLAQNDCIGAVVTQINANCEQRNSSSNTA